MVSASARRVPLMRRSAASPPGGTRVAAPSMWSYWRKIGRREPRFGLPSNRFRERERSGGSRRMKSSERMVACSGRGRDSRRREGAPSVSSSMGRWATFRFPSRTVR